jgi:RNA polymerase sigma-32 factor
MTPLTIDEERDLCARWQSGDRAAGGQIIQRCAGFVATIVREYRSWGAPREDLLQEANMGLLKAAERFDPNRGTRLITYAALWIRVYVCTYVVNSYRAVRVGTTKGALRLMRLVRRYAERDVNLLAQQSSLSEAEVTMLLPVLIAPDMSMEHVNNSHDGKVEAFGDSIPSPAPSPEDAVDEASARHHTTVAVRAAVAELPPRERRIIEARMLSGDDDATLRRLGEQFGVSRERVRQLEERATQRLRERLSFDEAILDTIPHAREATRNDGAQASFQWVTT